jgi:hypothetical protein
VPEGVKDGDSGAEDGGIFCCWDVGGDADGSFMVEEAVFRICIIKLMSFSWDR